MANGTTIASLRKMKDSQKQYLWQPAVAAGQPETFLGRPIIEAVDLPDPNTGTFPILFGDFASAFRIYDRIALSLLRDPYSQATSGLTRFHARRRVGARVVRPEAVRKLKCATS
jgi:HK97 family phage major capsid protein